MRRALPTTLAVLLSCVTLTMAQRQQKPETIFELVHAFDYTLKQILTPEEYEAYQSKPPEKIRAESPELYEKIRQNVERWTDDWIRDAVKKYEKLPKERLDDARRAISRVDGVLQPYFDARGWPYRTINAVFLPQRLFYDERDRGTQTYGMFIPFYPEVFFATVNPNLPLDLIFMHETIHFNQEGVWMGGPLIEGITDSAARHLVSKHGLVSDKQLRRHSTYEKERKLVDLIAGEIVERTGGDRESALDMLLEAYVTGDHTRIEAVLGKEAWDQVLDTSRTVRSWHLVTREVREALN